MCGTSCGGWPGDALQRHTLCMAPSSQLSQCIFEWDEDDINLLMTAKRGSHPSRFEQPNGLRHKEGLNKEGTG